MSGHLSFPGTVTLILSAFLPIEPAAAFWELVPQLTAGITHQSNPRYAPPGQNVDSVTGTVIDLQLPTSFQTPGNVVTLSPHITAIDYLESNKDLNQNNSYLELDASHRWDLGGVGLRAGYADVGIVTTEFESATPEDPDLPPPTTSGTGRFADATQTTWSVGSSLDYTLSARNSLQLSADTSDTSYDAQLGSGFFDYTYPSVSVTLGHKLNPKNALQLSLNGSSFNAEAPNGPSRNSTDSFSVNAGYEREISPTLSGQVTVGVARSSVSIEGLPFDPDTGALCFPARCAASAESRSFVGDISIRRRSEATTMNLNISRYLAPQSNGTEAVSDTVRFYLRRTLTARLSGTVATIYSSSSSVADLGPQDQTYFTVDTALSWQLTPTLSASGSYSYVTSNDNNSKDHNNLLNFRVSYTGVPIRR